MSRRCERPDCAVVATVGYGFDASQRVAWFVDLASTPRATAGALCRRHAAAMVLPRGWWLDDRRPESASRLFDAADGADGTSLRRPDSTPLDATAPPARTRARRARSTPVDQPALGLDESGPPTDQPLPAELDIAVDSEAAVDIDCAAIGAGSEIASDTDADAELDASVAIASGIEAAIHKPSVIEADADLDIDAESDLDVSLDASAANEEPPTPWVPSFDHADDLDGLLDARSPLLARAFRGRRRPGS